MKYTYDVLGEECYQILSQLDPPSSKSDTIAPTAEAEQFIKDAKPQQPKSKKDLYTILRDNKNQHPKLQQLWDEATNVPDWVDWEQIARGQDVFYRYGGATLTGLAFQSLLGGMGANRVVEVLARTGGFSVKVARHRLFETTQHILECTRSVESIQPGGTGFASSLRVRLLHAAVRQRIMKLAETRPDYYSVEKYGIPINDLDCIATIGTFSGTIIWLSLPRQGIWLREQEVVDYIALWRLIAHYMGTPTEWFETPARAKAMMESLLMNEINPTETSKILAANVIRCLENQPPTYASRSFLEVNARWLNGGDLCDALGIGHPSAWYWALMAGQCIFFMSVCYLYRSIPALDKRKVRALRNVFWTIIVEGKFGLGQETIFDFKYIPDYNVLTAKGGDDEAKARETSVERKYRNTLFITVGCITVAGYVGWRITSTILARIF